ncbi:hypothetical protein L0F63_000402 [Massospora cicadina]|nr:hypothetical protein L0F63_000402 [Massospora cicadina]
MSGRARFPFDKVNTPPPRLALETIDEGDGIAQNPSDEPSIFSDPRTKLTSPSHKSGLTLHSPGTNQARDTGSILPTNINPHPFSLDKVALHHDSFTILHGDDANLNFIPKRKTHPPKVNKAHLRKVKGSEFDAYLSELAPPFEEYRRLISENVSLLSPRSGLTSLEAGGCVGQPVTQGLPECFHDPGFSLDCATTFRAIGSLVSVEGVVEGELRVMTSPELQETLGQFLDRVESQLVREIGARSEGFFAALSTLQQLEGETDACIGRISDIRASLDLVRKTQVDGSRSIVQLRRRRENMLALKRAINVLKGARESENALKGLIDNRDPLTAISLIDELRQQLNLSDGPRLVTLRAPENGAAGGADLAPCSQKGTLPFDLGKAEGRSNLRLGQLNCLAALSSNLTERRSQVVGLLESRFVDILIGELMRSIISGAHLPAIVAELRAEGEKYLGGALELPLGLVFDAGERNSLKPLLNALYSARSLPKVLDVAIASLTEGIYKAQLQILSVYFDEPVSESEPAPPRSQKAWDPLVNVREVYLEGSPSPFTGRPGAGGLLRQALWFLLGDRVARLALTKKHPYGRQIRAATLEKFLDLLAVSYQALHRVVCRLASVHGYVEEFLLGEGGGFDWVTKADEGRQEAFEEVQSLASHLLGLRSESNSRLGAKDFHRLHKLVWAFVGYLEAGFGRAASVLRSSFLAHSHAFLYNFHEEKMKGVALNVDSDPWAASPVASDYQLMAHMLQHADTHRVNHPQLFFGCGPPSKLECETAEQLRVGGADYFVSISGLALLQMLLDYLRCAVNLPTLAQEVASRMTVLLDHFNQLVCQAVLGAGAMRTAGLNRISARHISVAAQTLAMAQASLPYLSACLALCPGKVLGSPLRRVGQDLGEHQSQLHAKLVAILADRAAIHLAKMGQVDWDLPAPGPVSQYMRDLVADVQSLHRIVGRYLRPKETQSVVTHVNREYAAALERAIPHLPLRTPSAKRRLLLDVQFLIAELSALSTQVSNLHHLEVVVNDIAL